MWQKATGYYLAEQLPGWRGGVLLVLLLVAPLVQTFAAADPPLLRVSVARSIKDLGLAEALVNEFRRTHPDVAVKLLSGGVLGVLDDGRQGLADVVITHHAFHERKFVEEGYGMLRTQILNTEYAVFGPPGDALGLSKETDIVGVLKLLAENEVDFYAPSPRSGTYMKIEELWSIAGINPTWLGYENTGGSGYATLLQAAELGAYTIAEMGTYVLNHAAVAGKIVPLYHGDNSLKNIYRATVVNPGKVRGVNAGIAAQFLDFLVADDTQNFIHDFGEKTFNTTVIFPSANLDTALRERRARNALEEKARNLQTLSGLALLLFIATMATIGLAVLNWRYRKNQLDALQRNLEVSESNHELLEANRRLTSEIDEHKQTAQRLSEALNLVKEWQTALFREKERAEVTLHSIGDAVITTDAEGNIDYVNPMAERLTGWTLDELRLRPIQDAIPIVDETGGGHIISPVLQSIQEEQVIETQHHHGLVRRDGRQVSIADSAAPIRDRHGKVVGSVMVIQDMTSTRKLAKQLSYQAAHDALTGLYNRREFETQLQAAIESARKDSTEHVLCYLDLDQFKLVNDTCGHVAGDELLRQITSRLGNSLRDSDVFARLGGDEFGILLRYCDINKGKDIAEEVRRAVKEFRFLWEDHVFDVSTSIGVVSINEHSNNIMDVMSAADVSCYTAKDLGRNTIYVYQADGSEVQQRRGEMQWVSRISRALDDDRFCLYYQPIMPMPGKKDLPVCYELVVRMIDEANNLVPPMAFIPAAERYHLMTFVDAWVIHNVLKALSTTIRIPADSRFMINLSGQSLNDDKFHFFVTEEFESTGVDPHSICFEITETAMISSLTTAVTLMEKLKEIGCSFALDDFGSGLSSFGYLKNLNVDYLKIDGGFIQGVAKDRADRAMVDAIIRIGHELDIRTIAEYVENEEVMTELCKMNLDFAQGNHIALPRPLVKWETFPNDAGQLYMTSG